MAGKMPIMSPCFCLTYSSMRALSVNVLTTYLPCRACASRLSTDAASSHDSRPAGPALVPCQGPCKRSPCAILYSATHSSSRRCRVESGSSATLTKHLATLLHVLQCAEQEHLDPSRGRRVCHQLPCTHKCAICFSTPQSVPEFSTHVTMASCMDNAYGSTAPASATQHGAQGS